MFGPKATDAMVESYGNAGLAEGLGVPLQKYLDVVLGYIGNVEYCLEELGGFCHIELSRTHDHSDCPICFGESTQESWIVLPCGHKLHFGCAAPWLHKATCPSCRAELPVKPRVRLTVVPSPEYCRDVDAGEPRVGAPLTEPRRTDGDVRSPRLLHAVSAAPAAERVPLSSPSAAPARGEGPCAAVELGSVPALPFASDDEAQLQAWRVAAHVIVSGFCAQRSCPVAGAERPGEVHFLASPHSGVATQCGGGSLLSGSFCRLFAL